VYFTKKLLGLLTLAMQGRELQERRGEKKGREGGGGGGEGSKGEGVGNETGELHPKTKSWLRLLW
jgi:hypothetical protein